MAGLTSQKSLGEGLQSSKPLAQYAAVAQMRWRIFINGLHSIHGILDLGATGIAWMLYAVFGLGVGFGLGAGGYAIVQDARLTWLPVLFWVASFVWLTVPVMAASYQEQSDLGILLRFPVTLRSYFNIYVISGLMEASTIVGSLCCLGLWLGITLARPQMAAPLALVLLIFAAFNILLVRAVFAWLDRWLAQRKTREILGVAFMLLFVSMQFFNPALYRHRDNRAPVSAQQRRERMREVRARYMPMLTTAYSVQQWLPPGSAARAVEQSAEGHSAPAVEWLSLLGIWALAAGGTLALRLRAEYRGESLGWAPARSPSAARERIAPERTSALGARGARAAIFEKEIHTLRRTLPLLWAVAVPLLMVLVIGGLFHPGASGVSFPYGVPLCVAYALLGFISVFYNNLGAEGAGIQLLFLSPTPIRTVVLAKNLLHGTLFILVAVLATVLSSFRLGVPPAALLAALGAWVLFALPANLAVGNILSLTMPYRINPGRIGRQPGSQASALTAMLIQVGILGIGAAVLAICWSIAKPWLAVPILLALAVAAYLVWKRVLSNVDGMALERREELIATLMKVQ